MKKNLFDAASRYTRVRSWAPFLAVILLTGLFGAAVAHPQEEDSQVEQGQSQQLAPVILDGRVLFRVRGIAAYPAEERARTISERIRSLAANRKFSPDQLTLRESEQIVELMFGDQTVVAVHSLDARSEGVDRQLLMSIQKKKIVEAIQQYRQERSTRRLLVSAGYTGLATVVLVLLLLLIWRLASRQTAWIEGRYKARIQDVRIQSFQIVQAERLWGTVQGLILGVRTLATLVLGLIYVQYVLGLFPWTRALAEQALALLLAPLRSIFWGAVEAVPSIVFIAVLFLVIRYLVKLLRLFFAAVENGTVQIAGFDPDWSWPTYKIFRLLLVAFGVIVAYPYIPGADTDAFKGVSIFLGVVFSLGSSSAISNVIAGYTMTYRRAFKVGDRVKIGEIVGEVTEIRLQVTHVRSLKNEEVIVPNSSILNSHVVNYSTLARQRGLILHTTVGIGYETPWRQVEAMLLLAASRTEGLLRDPEPFILQKALGDFCVTYELNVHTDQPQDSPRLYTALHRSILDVFNEYGIQIMTPAYEGDPAEPKVVPRDQWFASPASLPETADRPADRSSTE